MEQNNVYNLMHQLTQESKSLWRIQHNYLNESVTEEEKNFWIKTATEKEILIKELRALLTSHINA
jgi:hypothetical protein